MRDTSIILNDFRKRFAPRESVSLQTYFIIQHLPRGNRNLNLENKNGSQDFRFIWGRIQQYKMMTHDGIVFQPSANTLAEGYCNRRVRP